MTTAAAYTVRATDTGSGEAVVYAYASPPAAAHTPSPR